MKLEDWLSHRGPEEALLVSPQLGLIREEAGEVACPWAERDDHPTQMVSQGEVPPCAECPFYRGHERASQGSDEQTPWVGILCAYDGD